MIVGWSMHTDAGAVVAYYVATGEKGNLRFRDYQRPGGSVGGSYPDFGGSMSDGEREVPKGSEPNSMPLSFS